MKLFIKLFIVLFFVQVSAQKNKKTYSCKEIKNTITDSVLYDKLENGRLVFVPRLNKLHRIVVESNSSYYVTKPIKNKIRKSIRINKCKDIKIMDLLTTEDLKIMREKAKKESQGSTED